MPSATLIDGKAAADAIREELRARVAALTARLGRAPGLAVVLVGARADSATYVRNKKTACAAAGIADFGVDLPADASQADVLAAVAALNADARVDGVLVQLPLPAHVDERAVLRAISVEKDADGLHPLNMGALALKGHAPTSVACTPKGCLALLARAGVALDGKRAVVLGRSNIVGIPAALLLIEANATVTVCHSRTANLPDVVREVRGGRGACARPAPAHNRAPPLPPGRRAHRGHRQGQLCAGLVAQAGRGRHRRRHQLGARRGRRARLPARRRLRLCVVRGSRGRHHARARRRRPHDHRDAALQHGGSLRGARGARGRGVRGARRGARRAADAGAGGRPGVARVLARWTRRRAARGRARGAGTGAARRGAGRRSLTPGGAAVPSAAMR
jgi:5,10-methylene-tetrahydrofolate dehydrogenase/methenyl tetrahydrofolate cyclohydrolase